MKTQKTKVDTGLVTYNQWLKQAGDTLRQMVAKGQAEIDRGGNVVPVAIGVFWSESQRTRYMGPATVNGQMPDLYKALARNGYGLSGAEVQNVVFAIDEPRANERFVLKTPDRVDYFDINGMAL